MYNRYIPGAGGYTRIPEEDAPPTHQAARGTHGRKPIPRLRPRRLPARKKLPVPSPHCSKASSWTSWTAEMCFSCSFSSFSLWRGMTWS